MFRKLKAGYVAGVAAAMMLVGVQACNSPLPVLPEAAVAGAPQPAANLSLGGLVGGVLNTATTTVTNLVCTVDEIVQDIGIGGGTISACGNSLVVPANSLTGVTHIRLDPVKGATAVVQFYPEGLRFNPNAKPTLTLNTDGVPKGKTPYIVYTDDQGNVKEVLTTTGRSDHSISAQIGHFSRYAVAW